MSAATVTTEIVTVLGVLGVGSNPGSIRCFFEGPSRGPCTRADRPC